MNVLWYVRVFCCTLCCICIFIMYLVRNDKIDLCNQYKGASGIFLSIQRSFDAIFLRETHKRSPGSRWTDDYAKLHPIKCYNGLPSYWNRLAYQQKDPVDLYAWCWAIRVKNNWIYWHICNYCRPRMTYVPVAVIPYQSVSQDHTMIMMLHIYDKLEHKDA